MMYRNVQQQKVIGYNPVYTVIEESETFYIAHKVTGVEGAGCELEILRKQNYEPVPEPVWRDVTSRCGWVEGTLYDLGAGNISIIMNPSYRVTQINIQQAGGVIGKEPGDLGRQLTVRNVFIVECQEHA